jgi:MFS family permease
MTWLQGVMFPAMQVLLSRWAPSKESSRLLALAYAGCQLGTVLGLLSAGYLCSSPWGWPSVFYIEGGHNTLTCSISIYHQTYIVKHLPGRSQLFLETRH